MDEGVNKKSELKILKKVMWSLDCHDYTVRHDFCGFFVSEEVWGDLLLRGTCEWVTTEF